MTPTERFGDDLAGLDDRQRVVNCCDCGRVILLGPEDRPQLTGRTNCGGCPPPEQTGRRTVVLVGE